LEYTVQNKKSGYYLCLVSIHSCHTTQLTESEVIF